jgi:branched-chain amino acid transport system permease protein
MGAKILTKAFAAMTLGGFGSLPGAIIGGLILGILENLVAGYIGNSLTDIAAFLVIIFVLLLFPRGIFGQWKSTRV